MTVSEELLDAAMAAYAGTAGTSRVAMRAALEAAFAKATELWRPDGYRYSATEAIWPMLERVER